MLELEYLLHLIDVGFEWRDLTNWIVGLYIVKSFLPNVEMPQT